MFVSSFISFPHALHSSACSFFMFVMLLHILSSCYSLVCVFFLNFRQLPFTLLFFIHIHILPSFFRLVFLRFRHVLSSSFIHLLKKQHNLFTLNTFSLSKAFFTSSLNNARISFHFTSYESRICYESRIPNLEPHSTPESQILNPFRVINRTPDPESKNPIRTPTPESRIPFES